jgi:hypothetical protein
MDATTATCDPSAAAHVGYNRAIIKFRVRKGRESVCLCCVWPTLKAGVRFLKTTPTLNFTPISKRQKQGVRYENFHGKFFGGQLAQARVSSSARPILNQS